MIKIGVIGNTGYISKSLIAELLKSKDIYETKRIGRSGDFDIYLDLSDMLNYDFSVFKDLDYVIFTAAISSPDKCANEYDMAWKINVEGTKIVIKNLLNLGVKTIFLSSDAVYGKNELDIFTEDSVPKPFTPYGKMKKEIEDNFKDNKLFKCIRLSYVVSINDKFMSYCIDTYKNNSKIEVFHPFYRNCIFLNQVITIFIWLINNWNQFEPNILNACGDELISRVRIVDEMNRYLSNKLNYDIIKPEEYFFENRTRITQMKSLYLKKYGILREEMFSDKIRDELRSIGL